MPADGVDFGPPASDVSEEAYHVLCLSGACEAVHTSLSEPGPMSARPCIIIVFLNDVYTSGEEYVDHSSVSLRSVSCLGTSSRL